MFMCHRKSRMAGRGQYLHRHLSSWDSSDQDLRVGADQLSRARDKVAHRYSCIKKLCLSRLARLLSWVRALAAKLDNLSSIPRTHVIEEENQPVQLSSDLHQLAYMCT